MNQRSQQGSAFFLKRMALFFCIAIVGLVTDLVTKSVMFEQYFDPADPRPEVHWLVDGIFGIQTTTNPGALFGIGSGYSWLFALLSLVAVGAILVWLFLLQGCRDRWLTATLGLISGGILGNLYDRVGWGAKPDYPESIATNVRDWIYFRLEGVPWFDPWPNFNVADCCLVCGAALLFFHAFFLAVDEPGEDDVTKPATEKADPDKSGEPTEPRQ